MGDLSVSELAQGWFRDIQPTRSGDPAGNDIFRMLYNAYCRRNRSGGNFGSITDHHTACSELYRWYIHRYDTELNMPRGTKGLDRTAGPDDAAYTFDRIYCDDRQFRNYLETELPQSGSQDLLAFVLHTAVAFLVPLEELDKVLQGLGFHPLHVKNIHHLSIAYVLLIQESKTAAADFNPFSEVRRLYFKALEILGSSDGTAEESFCYADQETRMIRRILLQQKGLASRNFEVLIAQNRAELHTRHSRILSDFHRLSAVFIHIFDSSQPDGFDFPEEAYSFHRFVERLCKEKLSRKKFREQLTSMIDLNGKHPTRNVLILLWLYTYCCSFLPGIFISETTYRRITKQLKKTDTQWAEAAKAFYQDEMFDVYGFLTNQPGRSIPQVFRGSEFVTFINEKLLLQYGWGALNDKLPFDHYIYALKDLTIWMTLDGLCSGAAYDGRRLHGIAKDVDNVPFPLAAVTQIYDCLAQLHIQKAAQYPYKKLSPCPLKCDLYEQL